MVMASGRWLGVRLDLLASLLIGAVALAAVSVSQDVGRYFISEIIANSCFNSSSTRAKTILMSGAFKVKPLLPVEYSHNNHDLTSARASACLNVGLFHESQELKFAQEENFVRDARTKEACQGKYLSRRTS